MKAIGAGFNLREFKPLLGADPVVLQHWLADWHPRRLLLCVAAILLGAGLYGISLGCWRAPLQAFYTGIKFPLAIVLTAVGNSMLNAMLAPLLGLNLSFRQTLTVMLLSFTITSVLLGAFAPLAVFVVWNTPPFNPRTHLLSPEYGFLQLTHVAVIAYAGIMGNVCLVPTLRQWCGKNAVARNVLLSWLAGNLLLGSQICWVLRPFIWDPARPVEFLGPDPMRGSFYETVFQAAWRLVFG